MNVSSQPNIGKLVTAVLIISLIIISSNLSLINISATQDNNTLKFRKIAIVGIDSKSHLKLLNLTYVNKTLNLTTPSSSYKCNTTNISKPVLNVSVNIIANLTIDKDSKLLFRSVKIYNTSWSYSIYDLFYSVRSEKYNLTVFTRIYTNASDNEKYSLFVTSINIQPVPKKAVAIADAVVVVNSTKLSEYYQIIALTLQKYLNDNESKWVWDKVSKELEKLSKIVKDKLKDYDKSAKGLAIVMDFDLFNCVGAIISFIICVYGYRWLFAYCPLCAQVVTCIPACISIFTAWTCFLCVATGIGGCAACILPFGLCISEIQKLSSYCFS